MNSTPSLTFMEAVKKCFANYANFKGRARRSEFWWFWLFSCIVNSIFSMPLYFLINKKQGLIDAYNAGKMTLSQVDAQDPTTMIRILMVLAGIVALALLLPSLAAMARRLHDVGKSGAMILLYLVCGIGGLIPFCMCIPDGNPAPNQYGPSPKYVQ